MSLKRTIDIRKEESLQLGNRPSTRTAKCFVCDERIKGKALRLIMGRTPYSKATLPSKIGQLVGDDFMVVVCMEDVVCMRCAGLLNHLDKLETDLKVVRHTLTGYLASKYRLNHKEMNTKFEKQESEQKEKKSAPPAEAVKKIRKQYRCELCDFTTTDKDGVAVHAEECKQLPNGCALCPKRFATIQDHAQHAVLVHKLTSSCQLCSALFSSRQQVADHMKSHPHCSVCNTSFADQSQLDTHTANEHADPEPPAEPKIDDGVAEACLEELSNDHDHKSFSEADANGIEFHTCSICAITFLKASIYKEHMKMHEQTNAVIETEDRQTENSATNPSDPVSRVEEELEDLFEELHSDSPNLQDPSEKTAQNTLSDVSTQNNLHNPKRLFFDGSQDTHLKTQSIPIVSYVIAGDSIQVEAPDENGCRENNPVRSNFSLPEPPNETTSDRKSKCSQCDFSTDLPSELKQHSETHKSKQNEQCCVCLRRFLSECKLEMHLKDHVAEGGTKCSVCGNVLSGENALLEHCREHPAQKKTTMQCRVCPLTFATKRSAAAHEETHTDVFIFACTNCDRRFQSEEELSEHNARLHRTDPQCRFCGKEFDDLRALRSHENRRECAGKKYECAFCHRVFKTKTGVRHHSAIHTGEFKYCCDFCGRGFMSRMTLEEHRSKHTKEERYICDVCGRKFVFQSTYWIHRKWHDNPYPYKCNICGKQFRHSSLVSVHKRKHTGERPYKCPHCPLTFSVGGTLKRHVILHTGAYPYVCETCNRGFTTKDKYSTHRAKVHGDFELQNRKHKAKEYKMVVRETSNVDSEADEVDSWDLEKNVTLDQDVHINDGTGSTQGSESIVLDSTSVSLAGENGSTATRVVEIVMDDCYRPVATVTLAEIAGSHSHTWYQ